MIQPCEHSGGMFTQNPHAWDQDQNSILRATQDWFAHHVTLDGTPYTLDLDQIRAVIDQHKNTLVTARAGSGKTRVIVAKVAYLVARQKISLDNIAIFMFNRTAAQEVNQRLAKIAVDGKLLTSVTPRCASTFHKFALDVVKASGRYPKILTETSQSSIIRSAFNAAIQTSKTQLSRTQRQEYLQLAENFVTRAGQQFCDVQSLERLQRQISQTTSDPYHDLHRLAFLTYQNYRAALMPPQTDFNQLMVQATKLLTESNFTLRAQYQHFQYLMVDEYQDFSYLFYALLQAVRKNSPTANLFAVGDDWQAINRFAGSDVDYFLNFEHYFPEDNAQVQLLTNYRSDCKIVKNANHFMLTRYDKTACPAVAFTKKQGRVYHKNPQKVHFDATDITEDALGDGRYQNAIREALLKAQQDLPSNSDLVKAAKLLKSVVKIVKKHRRMSIMLLHRHNFTSFNGITLLIFQQALEIFLKREHIVLAQPLRVMTMHKSKGLEADVVILLEADHEQLFAEHPHATVFPFFGDNRAAEKADQLRLLYVALTRAKHKLYVMTTDKRNSV